MEYLIVLLVSRVRHMVVHDHVDQGMVVVEIQGRLQTLASLTPGEYKLDEIKQQYKDTFSDGFSE